MQTISLLIFCISIVLLCANFLDHKTIQHIFKTSLKQKTFYIIFSTISLFSFVTLSLAAEKNVPTTVVDKQRATPKVELKQEPATVIENEVEAAATQEKITVPSPSSIPKKVLTPQAVNKPTENQITTVTETILPPLETEQILDSVVQMIETTELHDIPAEEQEPVIELPPTPSIPVTITPEPTPKPNPIPEIAPVQTTIPPSLTFSCSIEKTCPQMRSCEEAYYHLNVCGFKKRDGDNDGIPCEDICK